MSFKTIRHRGRAVLALFMLTVIGLAGCSTSKPLTPEQEALARELMPVREVRVGGVVYAVNKKPGHDGIYEVSTRGKVPGSQKSMFTAVQRTYGCIRVHLTEVQSPWVRAEGPGTFCTQLRNIYRGR
ncbi:MAG: hypothetical protein AAF530_23525 [Pseudomonadota bacterium]